MDHVLWSCSQYARRTSHGGHEGKRQLLTFLTGSDCCLQYPPPDCALRTTHSCVRDLLIDEEPTQHCQLDDRGEGLRPALRHCQPLSAGYGCLSRHHETPRPTRDKPSDVQTNCLLHRNSIEGSLEILSGRPVTRMDRSRALSACTSVPTEGTVCTCSGCSASVIGCYIHGASG